MMQEYERRMLSYGVPAPPPVPPPPAAAPPQQLYGGHGGLVGADLGAQHGGHGVKQVSSCRQQSQPKILRLFAFSKPISSAPFVLHIFISDCCKM